MKEKGNRIGLFTLLSAIALSAGIFVGCYFIALSHRYIIVGKYDYILDQWTKKVYDDFIHYYDLREMSFEEKWGFSPFDTFKDNQSSTDTIE